MIPYFYDSVLYDPVLLGFRTFRIPYIYDPVLLWFRTLMIPYFYDSVLLWFHTFMIPYFYTYCIQRILLNLLGARGVMIIVVGNGNGDTSSNPWHIVHSTISRSTNNFGKGMNPIILSPAMGK